MAWESSNKDHPLVPFLFEMAEVGKVVHGMHASEGASGNISIMIDQEVDPSPLFTEQIPIRLTKPFTKLVGKFVFATGSNCRLRRISRNPLHSLALIEITSDGAEAIMHLHKDHSFSKPTSELKSHLMLHQRAVEKGNLKFNAVLHAHPRFVKLLSHIPEYQDEDYLNQELMRWHPEMIVFMPEGIAFVPYQLTGSDRLMQVTKDVIGEHKTIVWERHGLITTSQESLLAALDLLEYVESAAFSEYLNILAGKIAQKLTDPEVEEITSVFGVRTDLF
ncbi:MAG: class II aldolase/adducin family protein [Anaerolineales bacterium]